MSTIFISYRRSDSAGYTGRLSDSLESLLGPGKIFHDVEDIKPGDDFVQIIERYLKKAKIFLVIIGRDWLDAPDSQGNRRLDNPQDHVRIEVESALRLGNIVIPVLVGGASMPSSAELPGALAALANRQAIEITDSRWDHDVERLLQTLKETGFCRSRRRKLFGRSMSGEQKPGRILRIIATAAAAVALALGVKLFFAAPDLNGNWYFEGGDYLLIRQDGSHFSIERIDPGLQTAYEKGRGVFKGRHMEFNLDPVYSQQFRYRGDLELSWKGDRLRGTLTEVLSDKTIPIELSRDKPQSLESSASGR
jgi:hypothetical protein